MPEENFNPQQSLALIESMINNAKNRVSENGFMYLLWGWVVFICGLSQFVLMHFFKYPQHYVVWMLSWVVFFFQIFYLRRKKRKQRVRTYADHIISYVWIAFIVVIFLVGYLIGNLTGGEYYSHITPLMLAVYGFPIFVTGAIMQFRPLIFGGIGCWVLCIISTFIKEYDYQLLMIPASMLVAWIIPGYLLRAKYKSQN